MRAIDAWTDRAEGAALVVIDREGRALWPLLRSVLPANQIGDVCSGNDPWLLAGDVARAAHDGYGFLICLGGDGAYLAAIAGTRESGATLIGHGGGPASFPRNFGLPRDVERCVSKLAQGHGIPVDCVEMTPRNGATVEFVNMALWGTAQRAARYGGRFGKWGLGFRLAATVPQREQLELTMGDVRREFRASGLVVANGQFLDSMSLVPRAHPADGQLEVLVFEGPSHDLLRMVPRLRTGSHLPHPRVRELRPRSVDVDGRGRVFADGAEIGDLPASFRIVGDRIRLIV